MVTKTGWLPALRRTSARGRGPQSKRAHSPVGSPRPKSGNQNGRFGNDLQAPPLQRIVIRFSPPRHDFFSLDAAALRENCFCPILRVAYSEIRPLCATLALVSGKRPALVQSSSRSTCAPVPSLSFIVNLGNGALSLGASAFQTVLPTSPMLRRWTQSVYTFS